MARQVPNEVQPPSDLKRVTVAVKVKPLGTLFPRIRDELAGWYTELENLAQTMPKYELATKLEECRGLPGGQVALAYSATFVRKRITNPQQNPTKPNKTEPNQTQLNGTKQPKKDGCHGPRRIKNPRRSF